MRRTVARVPDLHGTVATGYEEVRDEFARNFQERGELGAACAIYHNGVLVVDLWGGCRNLECQLPWEEDTLICVFSTSKGLAAMTLAVAHSRGLLDLDRSVAAYWPEFAQNGKEHITVRQLLSHQAGLVAIDAPLDVQTIADPDSLGAAIAQQKPAWAPGLKQGYHAISLGWYQSELLRRVDPKHRRLSQFFQEEIARPLALEFYFGVPEKVSASRLAAAEDNHPFQALLHSYKLPPRFVTALLNPWSLASRSVRNPRFARPADIWRGKFRSVEIPSANGVGQVRSIAKAYSVFATGGHELGLCPETLETLAEPTASPLQDPRDQVLGVEVAYSCGFMKPFPGFRFGSSDRAFGTPGMGGSFGFADPDQQVGFAYAPNRCDYYLWNDPREKALRDAFYYCAERLSCRATGAVLVG
jgi:CubicO group peptidase (beta-lactamase class C family)